MKHCVFCFIIVLLFLSESQAQYSRYIVRLKHKGATDFTLNNPSAYLSQRALDRRTRYGIAIDSSDLPVPSTYIIQIDAIPNVEVLNTSRWFNAITIQTTDASAITAINNLSFVENTAGIAGRPGNPRRQPYTEEISPLFRAARQQKEMGADYFDYGNNSFNEIHLHNGEFLHNIGLRGEGMQITLMDGGFFNYTSLKAFDSVNINGQVLSTWDFVARNSSVVEDNSHGMMCFSTIAANIPGQFIGKAPKAAFHLFKTEDVSSEYPIEEFNWACGAERADSAGSDIISSSLGYGYEFDAPVADYPYSDLNGDITISARAADMAAKKGILVFNSAGNSGNDYWHYITTPADADSIIAVGAVNVNRVVGSFSSYGPAPDGRIKPDVASVGVSAMVQSTSNTVGAANGTSFAAPNMAGLGTCLWQGFPEFNNMRIVRALRESGSIYNTPDDRIGYGIPDLKKAFSQLLLEFASGTAVLNGCNAQISWTSKDVPAMKYEVERKTAGDINYTKIAEIIPQSAATLANHSYELSSSLNGLPAGAVRYRIRQLIDTAAASFAALYIDSADILITTPCTDVEADKLRVAPNPVTTSNTTLMIETPYAVNNLLINVYDMNGSLMMQFKRSKSVGLYTLDLPVGRLSAGKYIIRVYNDNKAIGKADLLKL